MLLGAPHAEFCPYPWNDSKQVASDPMFIARKDHSVLEGKHI